MFQLHWEQVWPTKIVTNICAHLLPLLDNVVANNVSLYTLCGNLLYCSWQSFELNQLDKNGCNTVWTSYCVVHQIVLSAFLGTVPHFLPRIQMVNPWYLLGIYCCNLQQWGSDKTFQHCGKNCHHPQHLQHHKHTMWHSYDVIEWINDWSLAGVLGVTNCPL